MKQLKQLVNFIPIILGLAVVSLMISIGITLIM
jgi:hypothetical protein